MKNLVVICVVLCALGLVKGFDYDVYKEEYRPLIDDCKSAGNYTEYDIKAVLDMNINEEGSLCLKACADEKYGLIEDGKYTDYEKLKIFYPEEDDEIELNKSFYECFNKGNEYGNGDICKAARHVTLCLQFI